MFHYTIIQWLFFFYLYSFFGWCFESTYVSIKSKRVINRGFMRGPFLPLYGSGAMMMLIVSRPFVGNIVLVYLAGCVGATALEYVTGVAMEALFNVRYWDYTPKKFNFQGHICLSSTLTWGFFTVAMTTWVQKPVERCVFKIPPHPLQIITLILTVVIVTDFTLAFKEAMDLRDILIKMENAKYEMSLMQKRLDMMIALATEQKDQKVQGITERYEELQNSLENKFGTLKGYIQDKPSAYLESIRDEVAELRGRYGHVKEAITASKLMNFYHRDVIRNNPDMVSRRFKDSFEEIKKVAYSKRENHK